MSRIGKYPVPVPNGVTVNLTGHELKAKGPKGELSLQIHEDVLVTLEDGKVKLAPKPGSELAKSLWPTMRTLVRNLVEGVNQGYTRQLDIQGVGLRAALQGSVLVLQLGFSHEVRYELPKGVQAQVENQTVIKLSGIDKQLVGEVAAKIRGFKPPEPYKGKGIRYNGEYVMRKEGKKK